MMTTVTPAHLLTGHIPTVTVLSCITVKSFNPVTALARCLLEVDQLALQLRPAATQHEGALLLAAPAIIYGQ